MSGESVERRARLAFVAVSPEVVRSQRVDGQHRGAVEAVVVGDRQRLHAQLRDLVDQLVDMAGPVEQAVFGMEMEVDELTHGGARGRSRSGR